MMNRREFLKTIGIATAALSLPSCVSTQPSSSSRRPNIVLIMSDDMGFSDIGCYGGEIHTPNLDRLAGEGIRFTQFYNTARCCPTRASLLTGLHPHQAGIGHMAENKNLPGYQGKLNHQCMTIAEVLKTAGYATYITAKWHVTGINTKPESDPSGWPLQRGFDRFYGILGGAASYYDPSLTRDNTPVSAYDDPAYQPEQYYFTNAISDNMSTFIEDHLQQQPEKPFFSYVAYTAAHWPMHALEKDIEKYKGRYDVGYDTIRKERFERLKKMGLINDGCQLSPTRGDWDKCDNKAWEARCMEVYAAMIDTMDQGIGRIVETLKKHNQLDNTLIFFLQDNGGCAEEVGRNNPKHWDLGDIQPMTAQQLQPRYDPPMRTRDGHSFQGGKAVMPGPDGTYIAYGENWANVSNTPFKEYKHWVHEGGISTPLIIHWPAGIRMQSRGKLRHQPGQLVDIMHTCVDAAGADYPQTYNGNSICPMQGVSLLEALNNDAPLPREALYWEHEGNRAIRIGPWKLVSRAEHYKPRFYDAVKVLNPDNWELYNIDRDRAEMNNLASQYPDKVRDMARQWQEWANRSQVYPKPKQ